MEKKSWLEEEDFLEDDYVRLILFCRRMEGETWLSSQTLPGNKI